MPKPRKLWSQLTPKVQRRYKNAGVHPNTYNAGKVPPGVGTAARGHGKTPEHPERAAKHPERYPEYIAQRRRRGPGDGGIIYELPSQVRRRKRELWADRHKYRPQRSDRAANTAPDKEGREFLRMSPDEAEDRASEVGRLANYEKLTNEQQSFVDNWSFMFYH